MVYFFNVQDIFVKFKILKPKNSSSNNLFLLNNMELSNFVVSAGMQITLLMVD